MSPEDESRVEHLAKEINETLIGYAGQFSAKLASGTFPERFVRMVCEAEFDTGAEDDNLLIWLLREFDDDHGRYKDIARSVLSSNFDGRGAPDDVGDSKEFIRLSDRISQTMGLDWDFDLQLKQSTPEGIIRLKNNFFISQLAEFGASQWYQCELVFHGVPLYCQDANGEFQRIPFTDPDYIFLSKMGEHGVQDVGQSEFPYWAKKFFMKTSDIEAHSRFFESREDGTPNDEMAPYGIDDDELPKYRAIFRQLIGVVDVAPAHVAAKHDSRKLLRIAHDVIAEFGDRTPYPKSTEVQPWLMEKYGISKRQADSIDVVTRPDSAR